MDEIGLENKSKVMFITLHNLKKLCLKKIVYHLISVFKTIPAGTVHVVVPDIEYAIAREV